MIEIGLFPEFVRLLHQFTLNLRILLNYNWNVNFTLKIINSGNNIDAEGTKYLSNSFQYNSSLLVLNLRGFLFCLIDYYSVNNIGAEGAKYLSNSLQYNSSLLALNLWSFLFA